MINPRDLWNTICLAANDQHIVGLDSTKVGEDSIELVIDGINGTYPVLNLPDTCGRTTQLLFIKSA